MDRFGAWLSAFVVVVALALAGCSGAVNTTPVAIPNGTLTAGASPGNASLTHPSGYSVSITLPTTSDGSTGTIAASITTTLPAGVAVPAADMRAPESIGVPLSPLVYIVLTPSATVTFNSTPAFSFTLPVGTAIAAGSSAFVALYDPTRTTKDWLTILGPGGVSGRTISFPAATEALTLRAGTSYAFLLFATTQLGLSLATAPPALLVNPASLTLAGVGQSYEGTLTVTESNGQPPQLNFGPNSFTPGGANPATSCNGYTFTNTGVVKGAVTVTVWQTLPVVGTCTFALPDLTSGETIGVPITLPTAGPISVGGS